MKRTKKPGGLETDARVMSYTNLAAMASEFENSAYGSVVPAILGESSAGSQPPEVLFQKAMEQINAGLRLDLNSPVQASEHYQQGAELLSHALEGAQPGSQTDEMQRTLDMVEERVRFITREAYGRSGSDSQITTDKPTSPASRMADDTFKLPAVASEARASNYFDMQRPYELPDELRAAVMLTSGMFEQLTRQFGFQQESTHNQQEHLAMLLANSASHEPDSVGGLDALHAKLLSNYKAWARQLGATPQCSGESDVPHNKAIDLVMYVLIWGEAANLRHVPESLCFLFHSMRSELWKASHSPMQRPQGWFLSRVIAPLYRHMRAEMNKKNARGQPLGHTRKPNYDDFNEFFWSAECLKYSYHIPDDDEVGPGPLGATMPGGGLLRETFGAPPMPPVSSLPACKRYVERRTWLHPIRSFWRVHSFLLLALHVLIALAFLETRTTGIALDAALAQAMCGLPVTHGILGVIRELLAVHSMHGMLHTHVVVLLSLLLRLSLKLGFTLVLGLSYHTMAVAAPFEALKGMPIDAWVSSTLRPNSVFCCAATAYIAPHALSSLTQIFPPLSSWVRSWTGPPKSFVDVFEPLNRLFVGKGEQASERASENAPRPRAPAARTRLVLDRRARSAVRALSVPLASQTSIRASLRSCLMTSFGCRYSRSSSASRTRTRSHPSSRRRTISGRSTSRSGRPTPTSVSCLTSLFSSCAGRLS